MRPGRYNEVAYEEAMALAAELYDFKTCVYPDGSGYGIADSKTCRKAPEGSLQDTLDKIYANKNVKPSAADVKRMTRILNEVEEKYGEKGIQQMADIYKTFLPTSEGRKSTMMTSEEIKALQDKDTQEKLLKGYEDPMSIKQGGKNAIINYRNYPPEILDAAYDAAPKHIQSSFNGAGKPNNNAWKGYDEDGNPINGGTGNPARGRELFKIWAAQDGKCAYTGLRLPFDYADLEHVKPMGQVGNKAEDPKNWVWSLRSVNQQKAESTMSDFYNKTKLKGSDAPGVNGVKDFKKYDTAVQEQVKAAAGKSQYRDRARDPNFVKEFMRDRNAVIESFGKQHEKYIALALGRQPTSKTDKLTLAEEVTVRGDRNAKKNLLGGQAKFNVGENTGKKQTAASWINKNYADMTPSQQRKVKELWNQAREELRDGNNPNGVTGAAVASRFADLINEQGI